MILRRVTPRGAALWVSLAAVGFALLAQLLSAAFAFSDDVSGTPLSNILWGGGLCFAPVFVGGLTLAALLERRPLSRGVLLVAATGGVLYGGLGIALGMSLEGSPLGMTLFTMVLLGAFPALGLGGLGALFIHKGARALQEGTDLEAMALAQQELDEEGRVSPTRLSALSGLSVDACATTLARMASDAPRRLALDEASGVLLSQDHLGEARRRLPGVIEAHGELRLTALAETLAVPEGQLQELLYSAFSAGALHGATVNWKKGVVRTIQANVGAPCPSCGGALEVVGKGTLQCGHCGAEVFS
ncbi:MAG: hypothetical protein H6741_24535 [Alphaproteobacteria bacterium]|nr:hypothetical protein [Alphaproteobacteria bacterium]